MKMSTSIFASSFPGQALQPTPKGVKVKGLGVFCIMINSLEITYYLSNESISFIT